MKRPLIALTASLTACSLAIAQDSEADLVRSLAHLEAKDEHVVLDYSDTWAAMEAIYGDPENPDNVILFYLDQSVPKALKAKGLNMAHPEAWNREHLWPQSLGAEHPIAKTDLHALRPVDAGINSSRGAKYFDNDGKAHQEVPDTYVTTQSWEVADRIKGDVARALFYMDVRYEGRDGEPDLVLANVPLAENQMAKLCTLLEWHVLDPVDNTEHQQHKTAASIQGNRNPFVDAPEMAVGIYGDRC